VERKKKVFRRIIGGVIGVFVLFSVIAFVVIKIYYDDVFARTMPGKYTASLRYEDVSDQYDRELYSFFSGENKLQGYLYGASNTKGLIVFSHGIGGGAENYFAEQLYFVDQGYQVFCYDNTGCYQSEGENLVGLPQSVIDLDAALTFVESEPCFEGLPIYLFGHSWGAYAVSSIFNFEGHDIAASVSISGFNCPTTMAVEWCNNMMGKFLTGILRPYLYLYQRCIFGEALEFTAVGGINNTDTPVLLIHGDADETILIDGAATVAYRDEITNPKAEVVIWTKEGQNGHNSFFGSVEAHAYLNELNEEYNALYQQYNEEIPENVEREFYAGVDKERASCPDAEFMQMILEFYEKK